MFTLDPERYMYLMCYKEFAHSLSELSVTDHNRV